MVRSSTLSFNVRGSGSIPPPPVYISRNAIGINYTAEGCAKYQNAETPVAPAGYCTDSFRFFYSAGVRVVRVPVYWESYELDRQAFVFDLANIITEAHKYGIKLILDNHHWETGSRLGWGIGFPNSVLGNYPARTGQPDYSNVRDFWQKFWDRTARTVNGRDVWDAQFDFLRDLVTLTRNNSSVLGYEILNEPEVWRNEDFAKVGQYHTLTVQRLRALTTKPLVLCWCLARGDAIDSAGRQSMAIPTTISRTNLIYDGHAYPPHALRMSYFKAIVAPFPEVQLWMGEFNSGFTAGATISRDQIFEYVQRMKSSSTYGWQLWDWDFKFDESVPCFNTCGVTADKIQPNETFQHLAEAIRVIKP